MIGIGDGTPVDVNARFFRFHPSATLVAASGGDHMDFVPGLNEASAHLVGAGPTDHIRGSKILMKVNDPHSTALRVKQQPQAPGRPPDQGGE